MKGTQIIRDEYQSWEHAEAKERRNQEPTAQHRAAKIPTEQEAYMTTQGKQARNLAPPHATQDHRGIIITAGLGIGSKFTSFSHLWILDLAQFKETTLLDVCLKTCVCARSMHTTERQAEQSRSLLPASCHYTEPET
jgi:hypothetical protein